ncbi:hypothetical protein [Fodinicola feengrottensis]|uniref:hypothetical protein n=1 Tax=Fodinicola feengrottensis TaxID=435914 RepID=UPI0013D0CA23|nr:hypothetical protein [Fodinicola feengrottensis]
MEDFLRGDVTAEEIAAALIGIFTGGVSCAVHCIAKSTRISSSCCVVQHIRRVRPPKHSIVLERLVRIRSAMSPSTAMSERWVLAFDATCGTCTKISTAVSQACGGRLKILPLSRDDVRGWRQEALGENPPWAPTLIQLTDGRPRAWTGTRMTARLARLLGPRSSMRVVRALGQLRHETLTPRPSTAVGRRQLLKFGAAGIAVAVE